MFVAGSAEEQLQWMEAVEDKLRQIRKTLGAENPYTSSSESECEGRRRHWSAPKVRNNCLYLILAYRWRTVKTVEALREIVPAPSVAQDLEDIPREWIAIDRTMQESFGDDGEDWRTVRRHRITEVSRG